MIPLLIKCRRVAFIVLVCCYCWFLGIGGFSENAKAAPFIPREKLFFNLGNNAWRYAKQGEDFMERQRYWEAIAVLKLALELDGTSPLAASIYHNLGLSYRAVGAYDLAMVSHQRAMRLKPDFEMYAYHWVVTLQAAGGVEELNTAQEQLTQWQQVYPDNMELQRLQRYLVERAHLSHPSSHP